MNTLRGQPCRRRILRLNLAILLSAVGLTVIGPASPAHADPACVNGGVYAVFARGSLEHLNDQQAHQFYWSVKAAVEARGVSFAWSELGNEDGTVSVNMSADPGSYGSSPPEPDASNEYPAQILEVPSDSRSVWQYDQSVTTGANELVTHLNNRVAKCPQESIVLGGYSQGADVVGWVLQRSDLSQTVRNHIGFIALYGDPRFDPGSLSDRQNQVNFSSNWWWVRGDDAGFKYVTAPYPNAPTYTAPATGTLGARRPYVDSQFKGRFGSWCAAGDAMCAGYFTGGMDVHGNMYQDRNQNGQVCSGHTGWISCSAAEIAYEAIQMRNALNPSSLPATSASYTPPDPNSGPVVVPPSSTPAPPPPTILQVKRSLSPDGSTHEVYAATNSTVTEGWWQPGGDGVHNDQIINISQGNIVGIDKVNMPDGVTQSIYTAVPDGVWESWWRAGTGVSSNKIVSGLTGVRQVIVANAYESGQFVHRLYLLAQDGPYEVWWKDGGDGVHVDRLNNVTGGVAMAAGTGPDGSYEVFVATPTWVYELSWFPGGTVNARTILNITQGDIRSLAKDTFGTNGELLYTGTSTAAWQSYWTPGSGIETHAAMSGQTNAIQVEKDNYNGVHELYLAMGDHVQEYWWRNDGSNGTDTLITISQNNITSFDKGDDGNYQQIYTTSGDLVYETYWAAGVSPTSDVLFSVTS